MLAISIMLPINIFSSFYNGHVFLQRKKLLKFKKYLCIFRKKDMHQHVNNDYL